MWEIGALNIWMHCSCSLKVIVIVRVASFPTSRRPLYSMQDRNPFLFAAMDADMREFSIVSCCLNIRLSFWTNAASGKPVTKQQTIHAVVILVFTKDLQFSPSCMFMKALVAYWRSRIQCWHKLYTVNQSQSTVRTSTLTRNTPYDLLDKAGHQIQAQVSKRQHTPWPVSLQRASVYISYAEQYLLLPFTCCDLLT